MLEDKKYTHKHSTLDFVICKKKNDGNTMQLQYTVLWNLASHTLFAKGLN